MNEVKTVSHHGYDCLQFTIRVTMKPRWVPHFLGMLERMQYLGGIGSSRNVTFFSDGDGDFRPKFEWPQKIDQVARGEEDGAGDFYFDAG